MTKSALEDSNKENDLDDEGQTSGCRIDFFTLVQFHGGLGKGLFVVLMLFLEPFYLRLDGLHLALGLNLLMGEWIEKELEEEGGQDDGDTEILPGEDGIDKDARIVDGLVDEGMKKRAHDYI